MGFYQRSPKAKLVRQLSNSNFINFELCLANYATRMLLGKGIEFKSENEEVHKLWHDFSKRNRISELMYEATLNASMKGYTVITINIDEDNRPYWNLANLLYNCPIGTNLIEEEVAILYERFAIGTTNFIVRSVYDTKRVVRTIYNSGDFKQLSNQEIIKKIPEKQRIKMTWEHNLGFCPVFVLYNKPFRRFKMTWGNVGQSDNIGNEPEMYDEFSVSDIAPAPHAGELINNIYRQMYKELIFSKSRIIVSDQPQYSGRIDNGNDEEWLIAASDFIINNSGQGEVKIQQNQNRLSEYSNAIASMTEDGFRKCGYSIRAGGSAQKTATESAGEFYESIETTNLKRGTQGECWVRGLIKTFKVMGIDLEEDRESWSFQINKNIVVDEAALRQNLLLEIQAGMKTIPDAISELRGIDKDYATQVWEENKKWFTENDFPIAMKDSGGGVAGVKGAETQSDPEQDKGGRPNETE